MRDCPACHQPVDGLVCVNCGFDENEQHALNASAHAYNEARARYLAAGPQPTTTNAPPPTRDQVRQVLDQFSDRMRHPDHPRAWITRLLQRYADGSYPYPHLVPDVVALLHPSQQQSVKRLQEQREPGADDE